MIYRFYYFAKEIKIYRNEINWTFNTISNERNDKTEKFKRQKSNVLDKVKIKCEHDTSKNFLL